jgi:VWFA-related protein
MLTGRGITPFLVLAAFLYLLAREQPVLRTNVDLVEVSIVAAGSKDSRPADLKASDFRVWDNGREQTVLSLELISQGPASIDRGLPPNTYSNRISLDGRPQVLSMILLDGLNTTLIDQQRLIPQLVKILSQIGPEEPVAVFTLGNTLRTLHAFTSDRFSLVAKLARYAGENPALATDSEEEAEIDQLSGWAGSDRSPDLTGPDAFKRKVRRTFEALEQLANHVKGVPGRKNLLWLSGAFPMVYGMPEVDPARKQYADASRRSLFKDLTVFSAEMNRTVRAMNEANVVVYPIDSRGLSASPKASINQGTMNLLADRTGGKAFYNRNDIDRSLRLALDDSRNTYLLTYTPRGLVRDGSSHSIRIESTRPGLRLRYRRSYFAPVTEQAAPAADANQLERALASPLNVPDIGIQASLDLAGHQADEAALTVYIEAADLELAANSATWDGAIRIEALQASAAGETFGGTRQDVSLALSREAYQRGLSDGLRFPISLKRDARASFVRVGVLDMNSGRTGSLSVPLRAKPR